MAKQNRAVVHHVGGKRFTGASPDGVEVTIDGSEGDRLGMRPMELVLNALGACAAFDIAEMIAKRRIELKSYRIELVGDRPDAVPAPYTQIFARHHIDAPGLERAMAERFVDLGMNKYCSVGASLNARLEFEVVLEHEHAAEGAGKGSE